MRRRLRRAGLHLLVRLPADAEIWRLLIARALYQGSERRDDERVAVGSPVAIGIGPSEPEAESTTVLVDLSNRGCRLRTEKAFSEGDPVAFTLPEDRESGGLGERLTLQGQVRRIALEAGSDVRTLAVVLLTAAMMLLEIAAGIIYGSMALLADGLHMNMATPMEMRLITITMDTPTNTIITYARHTCMYWPTL